MTALEHLRKYPARTLDAPTLRILLRDMTRDLEFHVKALEALERVPAADYAGDLDADLLEWRGDVDRLRSAIATVDEELRSRHRL